MQFGRSRFPFPVPFPFPLSALPLCCSPSAVFLSEFVASLRHLLYEQLFACHWISPCPSPRTLPFPPPATVLIFDMTNVRRLIRPQTTRSSPKPANLLRCSALHCTALWQSKPCFNYTKRRLSRHATPPASHLPHGTVHSAFVVLGLNWTTLCKARGKTN